MLDEEAEVCRELRSHIFFALGHNIIFSGS